MLATRMAFGQELIEIAKTNDSFFICHPDTKSCGLENFGKMFPGRSASFGIAEQNLVATAAGIASCGNKVFVPTFSVFLTLRACDQIRSLVCYPNLNVTLIGTHSGLQVGKDGGTHIAVEDLAVMRSLPNMAIVEPSDEISARAVAHMAVQYQGPLYIRLHRSSAPRIHSDDYRFNFGKAETVCKYGKDAVIFSAGILLDYALKAAEILHIEGIKVKVIEVHTIKPIDKDAIISAAKETKAVAVIQDHSIYGGLGSAIAEVLSAECPTRMRCLGIQDKFGESGEPEDLYRDNSMTVDDLVRSVKELVELKAS